MINNLTEAKVAVSELRKLEEMLTNAETATLKRQAEIRQQAEEEAAKLSDLLLATTQEMRTKLEQLRNDIYNYHDRILQLDPDKKTLVIPVGNTAVEVRIRAQEPEIVRDDKRALAVCKSVPVLNHYIKTSVIEKLDWQNLKKQSILDTKTQTVRYIDTTNNVDVVIDGISVIARDPARTIVFEEIVDTDVETCGKVDVVDI